MDVSKKTIDANCYQAQEYKAFFNTNWLSSTKFKCTIL